MEYEEIESAYCSRCVHCKSYKGKQLPCKRIDHDRIRFHKPCFASYESVIRCHMPCFDFEPNPGYVLLKKLWDTDYRFHKHEYSKQLLENYQAPFISRYIPLDIGEKNTIYCMRTWDFIEGRIFREDGQLNVFECQKQSRKQYISPHDDKKYTGYPITIYPVDGVEIALL